MKKYTLLSAILHILLLLIVSLTSPLEEKEQQDEEPTGSYEVELSEGVNKESGTKILEIDLNGNSKVIDNRQFYYGIGVNVEYISIGYEITEVHDGYPASNHGIKVGDVIIYINNNPISFNNDLKTTNKEQKLILTIKRNNDTLYISIVTTKIYYQ